MPAKLLQYAHFMKGLDPVADAFAGTVSTDIVNFADFSSIIFIRHEGVGTTGTSTLTIEASDDISATNVTAIPFRYKIMTATDVEGALTSATTAGFTTTAGSSHVYMLEASSEEMGDTGFGYVRMTMVEVANDPVLGGVMILGIGSRYAQDIPKTALT